MAATLIHLEQKSREIAVPQSVNLLPMGLSQIPLADDRITMIAAQIRLLFIKMLTGNRKSWGDTI